MLAARYARERGVPYLGLCLGLQCGVIEFARDVVGERDANSTEFDLFTDAPVIDLMPDQREVEDKGGSMRLGLYPARLTPGTQGRGRLRHRGHLRAPPPPLRGQQPVPRGARVGGHAHLRASHPMGGWWRSWSCATIPGSWPASSTPSSRAAPTARIRCSGLRAGGHRERGATHQGPRRRRGIAGDRVRGGLIPPRSSSRSPCHPSRVAPASIPT